MYQGLSNNSNVFNNPTLTCHPIIPRCVLLDAFTSHLVRYLSPHILTICRISYRQELSLSLKSSFYRFLPVRPAPVETTFSFSPGQQTLLAMMMSNGEMRQFPAENGTFNSEGFEDEFSDDMSCLSHAPATWHGKPERSFSRKTGRGLDMKEQRRK